MGDLKCDVFLVGAGIMSTTLASLLTKFGDTNTKIMISERLHDSGLESSDTLNNAGTGHAGYCELNYTPIDKNGNIDTSRALKINDAFNKSVKFWDKLINDGDINGDFMFKVPHISFVSGIDDVNFLKKRFKALKKHENFKNIEFTTSIKKIKQWIPLMMDNRDDGIVAATKIDTGLEVDYGKLSRYLSEYLIKNGVTINYNEEVIDISKNKSDDTWVITQKNTISGKLTNISTKYLFIGAGGASIKLLEMTGIEEIKDYGGFPVSGEWFMCNNQEIINKHYAKVYGKTNDKNPPMTAPHLDTRIINGKKQLLFGPYALGTTKLLKFGSWFDFFTTINRYNILNILSAGIKNTVLVKYLLSEIFKTKNEKFQDLLKFYPNAKESDWELIKAGQRVQVIKKKDGNGFIQFDTELIISEDKTIAALLGASPGASTSVDIMLKLLNKSFGGKNINY